VRGPSPEVPTANCSGSASSAARSSSARSGSARRSRAPRRSPAGGSSAAPEWDALQKLRKEAEEARQTAIEAQAEAELTREVLAQRLAELQRESERETELAEARAHLKPGDRVVVPRLGYDRPGRVSKIDTKKKTAVVAIGHVTWDVTLDEIIPQTQGNEPGPGKSVSGGRPPTPARPAARPGKVIPLERFSDE